MANIKFNDMNLNKDEAEYNFNSVMKLKNFWPVEGRKNDNLYILQSTLDVLFNKHDDSPRIYAASALSSQNSTRLIIQCKICNTDLSSYDPFIGHDKGKNHRKNLQVFLNEDTSNPNISVTPKFRKWDEPNEGFHFSKGSLEEKLSQTSHPTLGHQFVYKSIGEEIYFCQLCYMNRHPPKRMNKIEAFQHIIGEKHILKFLEIKYNKHYTRDYNIFEDADFKNILKLEGKISSNILKAHSITEVPRNKIKYTCKSPCQQSTQTEQEPETIEMFLDRLLELKESLPNNEGLVNLLKKDSNAYDLIIVLLKILTQKFCIYSKNRDKDFLESSLKLMEKTNALKIPPTPVDFELD